MDKISIFVAVYNAEKTLKKCVDSLIGQTLKNTEIILVNDCSKDNSSSICKQYESEYSNVIAIDNPYNVGVSATRNNGIEKAKGDYICFVDSDDYVEPDYLEQLLNNFKKYNTVPICGFIYHDEVNHCKPVKYSWSGGEEKVSLGDAFKLNAELYLTALWNKLFDMQIIEKFYIRFDENLSMGEDLRFSVEYFEKSDTEFVYAFSAHLYHYTKLSENTLMSDFARGNAEDGIKSLKMIYDLAVKYNSDAELEYNKAVKNLKDNYIYFLVRDKKYSWKQQLKKIRGFSEKYTLLTFFVDKLKAVREKFV